MTTPNNGSGDGLDEFVESICGDDPFRIEEDLGRGFVRLRTSEAERRQAVQDIRSTEDAVIELLRNARDANAEHIFLAFSKHDERRTVIVIDDGIGIPAEMHDAVFRSRVTSKLDSSTLDRWGIHGRGMALYSISVNADEAMIQCSERGIGTSVKMVTDIRHLPEKTDQSTFPRFEVVSGTYAMRGPKNILRIVAEFAFEHKDTLRIYCGSPSEIASVLYEYGLATVTPSQRAFTEDLNSVELIRRLGYATDPAGFVEIAMGLGLDLSERTARRIMDTRAAVPSIMDRIVSEAFPKTPSSSPRKRTPATPRRDESRIRFNEDDLGLFADSMERAYRELASKYSLEGSVSPTISQSKGVLTVEFPLMKD